MLLHRCYYFPISLALSSLNSQSVRLQMFAVAQDVIQSEEHRASGVQFRRKRGLERRV